MNPKQLPPACFFLLAITLSILPLCSALAADDEAELGPGVAQKVNKEDAPLDHAVMKDAAREGVRRSGAGDPLKPSEPIKDEWFQSGKFPSDTYSYNLGADGKIYGKGQTPPPGEVQLLRITITQWQGAWVARAKIYREYDGRVELAGSGSSGASADDYLESDKGHGWDKDGLSTEERNEIRGHKFDAKDPHTAVRQALLRLQMKNKLYDPTREITEGPTAPKEEPKASEKKEPAPEPKGEEPVQQAYHGRQAHPVHGAASETKTNSIGTGVDYKFHSYQIGASYTPRFKIVEDQPPLPAPRTFIDPYYLPRLDTYPGFVLIGAPPAASDSYATYPSEPWWGGSPLDSIYRYSGDQWGDCLGPSCVQRGGFRPPVGSWVHFTPMHTERRDDLRIFVGYSDTIDALSQRLGPVVELKNDQQ